MSSEDSRDSETEAAEQNQRLSGLLDGAWADFDIVRIERIERVDPQSKITGWRCHYNE